MSEQLNAVNYLSQSPLCDLIITTTTTTMVTTIEVRSGQFSAALLAVCLILGGLCTLGLQSASGASVSAPQRIKRGLLTDEAERLLRQGSQVDVNNVGQLADLVERNRADECLARVICELSHNPKSHGENGTKFAQSLLKFRQSKHPKVKQYVDAMANGAKSRSSEQCRAHYPRCNHSTAESATKGISISGLANQLQRPNQWKGCHRSYLCFEGQ